jgi:hypothetical protein
LVELANLVGKEHKTLHKKYVAVALLVVVMCAACGQATETPSEATQPAESPSTQTPKEAASIVQSLPDLEYLIEQASTGKAQLKDGVFEEPAAPDSATKTKIWLGDIQALGDVNGDGAEDALVTLVVDPGGSGTFTYLVLVVNEDGTAKPLAAVLLGDRIIVKSLALKPGSALVSLLTRKPDEPMSAEPTVEERREFQLQDGRLVEVGE